MQKLITKYGLAAHLALAAVAPLFLCPTAVIWLSVLAGIWLVMEPSRIGHEKLFGARKRVAHAIFKDPIFWICLFLLLVSIVRFLNTGIALAYDAEEGKWFVSSADYPLLPGSVTGSGYPLIGCAVALLVVVLGCRHGLGRSARGVFAMMSSALSGLGVWILVLFFCDGALLAEKMSCLPTNPSYDGCVLGIYLILAVVALAMAFERQWVKAMPLSLVGISGNLMGLFVFSPSAVSAAFLIAVLVVLAYTFVYLRLFVARTTEFKFFVLFASSVTLAVVVTMGRIPALIVDARIESFLTGSFLSEGFIETRAALSDLAAGIWKSNPWLGCGLGSFPLELQFNATASDWSVVSPLQKAIPNGYWMLLVERGVIGAFFLAVPVALLLFRYFMRLAKGVRLAIPNPLAWTGLILFVVAALEMLVDVSFLSPAACVSLAAVLALSANAFPKELRTNV